MTSGPGVAGPWPPFPQVQHAVPWQQPFWSEVELRLNNTYAQSVYLHTSYTRQIQELGCTFREWMVEKKIGTVKVFVASCILCAYSMPSMPMITVSCVHILA
jgi:hypothetical protein